MDLEILKKKLSSFRGEGGRVTKVSDELLLEILIAWENWTGSSRDFYSAIGSNHKKMARMIGKAKQLRRDGVVAPFQEIAIEGITDSVSPPAIPCDIELQEKGKIIRFRKVDLLVEYLKKVS
ncbi:hypothetical protein [Pseudobacteriovorax antillogorgiicola]|uniref:Uncharacterized protein n=1 Tax=Pseudobacteriovorax antillogorgiicola TaxID=1513793 RepID=A0A1Y6CY98_9BACT|nr:hypothetical protein [Pseudobacteriovorax antillogorgiicola]TCS40470.1 hypothetical protein EDD56_1593 [Pseudobacteriovorax antillogorgiicola]SMF84801.1 hypothetical protein SAMN06296036_1621 [Pseudobacteriovorax antillogorgiicola]